MGSESADDRVPPSQPRRRGAWPAGWVKLRPRDVAPRGCVLWVPIARMWVPIVACGCSSPVLAPRDLGFCRPLSGERHPHESIGTHRAWTSKERKGTPRRPHEAVWWPPPRCPPCSLSHVAMRRQAPSRTHRFPPWSWGCRAGRCARRSQVRRRTSPGREE